MAAKEVSMLCELLGLRGGGKESSISNGSLRQRITHLKAAVLVLLESSKEKLDAVTSNGDLEDVEIVHSKTNGSSVLTIDLTAVEVLEVELNETRNKLEEREGELKECLVRVRSQEVEVDRLTSLLNVTTTKLTAAEEENKLMSEDLERKNENEDEQIRRDMNIRNEAVKEKNMAWIELSQTKGELLQTNHQLMEVIQQKVELGQQLERWQQDMQQLVDQRLQESMKASSK